MSGLRAKKAQGSGVVYTEHTRRYVFFPLHDLNVTGSNHKTPIWNPKIPKGRIILLESCPYKELMDNEDPFSGNGAQLVDSIMPTHAQVDYLTSAFGIKGMIYLSDMDDLTVEQAMEVEALFYEKVDLNGEYVVPKDLISMGEHFRSLKFKSDSPIEVIAAKCTEKILKSILTATSWTREHCNMLESELTKAALGKPARPELNANDEYYFGQIQRPMPSDVEGVNMGSEIGKALQPLVEMVGQGKLAQPSDEGEFSSENVELKVQEEKIAELIAENERLAKEKEEVEQALDDLSGE